MMKATRIIMGMPITVEIAEKASEADIEKIFDYFSKVDERYSPYKEHSELSRINSGLPKSEWSSEMKAVLDRCEETKQQTGGYFDIMQNGKIDPSGLVKGWAIQHAARLLEHAGFKNFYIEAGGDIQANGRNADGKAWIVGIRNPFAINEIIKIIAVSDKGIATSGTYIRGEHIYNPLKPDQKIPGIKSMTVIGPNVYDADRYATAAFAMGGKGIAFIEDLPGFEGYMINDQKIATYTNGFETYVATTN
jgi:thiamine biosynthesis lipoprotein